MKVAIIGAGGLVGSEFTRQLSNDHEVLPLTHNDLDITKSKEIERIIFGERPALVINCAVLGMDACELDPKLAWNVNANGAKSLALASATIDAEFVQISTNYVFGGKRKGDTFYSFTDEPKPRSVYG